MAQLKTTLSLVLVNGFDKDEALEMVRFLFDYGLRTFRSILSSSEEAQMFIRKLGVVGDTQVSTFVVLLSNGQPVYVHDSVNVVDLPQMMSGERTVPLLRCRQCGSELQPDGTTGWGKCTNCQVASVYQGSTPS